MKICLVTDSYPPNIGGAEIVIENIAKGIAYHGIETTVITTLSDIKPTTKHEVTNVLVIRIKIPNFLKRFWFMVFSISTILRHAKDADLIHGTSYGGIIPSYIAGKILKKPVVITVHEFMGFKWFKFTRNYLAACFYYLSEKIFARLAFSKFVSVSNYTKNVLIECGANPKKVDVIYNGESFDEIKFDKSSEKIRMELGINPNEVLFAAYGRTGITKGFEYLINAIHMLLNENMHLKFLLILSAGNRKIFKRITKKIQKLNQTRIILFNSLEKDKLFCYLNAADFIIIPSLSEGFGYTTVEAVKLNKNIIATNVGAIPEVIGGNYILVEPQSSEAIKNGCIRAINKEFQYKKPLKINWDDSIKRYIELYKEIINLSK